MQRIRRDAHMDEVPPLVPDEFYILMLLGSVLWQLLTLGLMIYMYWGGI